MSDNGSEFLPLPPKEFYKQHQERAQKIAAIPDGEFIDRFLPKREVKPLEAIFTEEHISPTDLPTLIQRKASKIVTDSATNEYLYGEDGDVDLLYNLYRNLVVNPNGSSSSEVAHSLATFDQFVSRYAQRVDPKVLANVIKRIQSHINYIIHPERTLGVSYNDGVPRSGGIYLYNGEWLRLPGEGSDYRRYVERSVVDEVARMEEKGGLPKGCVYHATGSASLEGIGESGAILSARAAQARGQTVKTGEFATQIGWGNVDPLTGERLGLSDVYAASGLTGDYATIRWFNEFPVVFGISRDKFGKYLESIGKNSHIAEIIGGDGYVIGTKVPMQTVEAAYTQSRFIPQLTDWIQTYGHEGTKVVSLEAAMNYETIIKNLAAIKSQEGIVLS